MHIHASAFFIGGTIPFRYTCDGDNLSPPLHWDEPPQGTNSFALIVEDPDAPNLDFTHWVLYNLPGDRRELPEAVGNQPTLPDGGMAKTISIDWALVPLVHLMAMALIATSSSCLRWIDFWI